MNVRKHGIWEEFQGEESGRWIAKSEGIGLIVEARTKRQLRAKEKSILLHMLDYYTEQQYADGVLAVKAALIQQRDHVKSATSVKGGHGNSLAAVVEKAAVSEGKKAMVRIERSRAEYSEPSLTATELLSGDHDTKGRICCMA